MQNIDELKDVIREIDSAIISQIRATEDIPYLERLDELFNTYMGLLKKYPDLIEIDFPSFNEKCKEYCDKINDAIAFYLNGNLQESFHQMEELLVLGEYSKNEPTATYYSSVHELSRGETIYRARKNERKPFEKKDLFHVPFPSRGIISTMRFSIPGFPCLYMGSSPYCCWKELGMPDKFSIAKITCKFKKSIPLLDMRFSILDEVGLNTHQLLGYLIFYPFRIACSIPVPEERQNDKFKPEYIVPQILLHTSIVGKASKRFDGIITTSTKYFQKGYLFKDIRSADNIIIPAKNDELNENGHSQTLINAFDISIHHDNRFKHVEHRSRNNDYWKSLR